MPSRSTRETEVGNAAHASWAESARASASSAAGFASRSARNKSGSTSLLTSVVVPGAQHAHWRVAPPDEIFCGIDKLTAFLLHLEGAQQALVEQLPHAPGGEPVPVSLQKHHSAA